MFIDVLVSSTVLVFLAELGDKTMITTLCLSAQCRRPVTVLAVAMLALISSTIIAVVVGALMNTALPTDIIRVVSGILFLIMGAYTILQNSDDTSETADDSSLLGMFALVFLSEMGDKTQITALALAAQTGLIIIVLIGSIIGLFLVNAIGAGLGSRLSEGQSLNRIRQIAGLTFIVFGILILIGLF